ncbi:flagellar M-ring protein FliF [Alkalispirochaeta americana]|uniref:Flagellar M-ring protein n=1 Tax=Alkalispirochaeta americana TaxID=159291 RepID=A0A1N6PL08_9SPIO|nr:flagellar basal-body MS-ring/collar protein FliF [Alkalispirochaeta americana]SIQ05064.1 flagellar M-ring protein FliF [Alkalispirochaeta americana]
MKELFARLRERIQSLWGQWKTPQKLMFGGIIAVTLVALVMLVVFSASPTQVPLLRRPITDPQQLNDIANRLDQENVSYTITPDNRIMLDDEQTAQRMRSILTREDLIPSGTDPWELFDVERWTLTDFERNVNLRRSITRQIERHITALSDIDAASVSIVLPERQLFTSEQNPVTASVILTPRPGSDIRENRKKIQGIEKLIQFGVEGLQAEHITITDPSGVVLNDFQSLQEFDRLELTRRELAIIREQETLYRQSIVNALAEIFGRHRVQVVNINVDMDMGKRTEETEEFFPIVTVPNNPNTPFDETEFVLSIPRSRERVDEKYEGTGFNPQGPPGMEGQTPPAYRDLEGLVGRWSNEEDRTNYEINTRRTMEEKSPTIERITASVAIDGTWRWSYDERGNVKTNPDGSILREYTPVSTEELQAARELVEHAVGFSDRRRDSVSVRHLQFDRSAQFQEEDERFRRQRQIQMIVLYVLVSIAIILVSFIVFRLVSREIERRRRLREEELARQHQAMREAALRSAEEESAEVEMSVEERTRMELEEMAINMAREHPEDVAQLVRTWLAEE